MEAERAIVLSVEDYHALVARRPDFKAYLLGGPKVDDFAIERDRDTCRAVDLCSWRLASSSTRTSFWKRAKGMPRPV